jgi:hypothetical protein
VAKLDPSSTSPGVDVVKAAKHRSSGDRSVANQGLRNGALQREAPVGAVAVAVLGELDEYGPQMSLVDDDEAG